MTLRDATPADVPVLLAIRASVAENYLSRQALARMGITRRKVASWVADQGFVTIIAEVDGEDAGYAMAQIEAGYICALFVRPVFENRGIGRALLATIECRLRAAGTTRAWLATADDPRLRAVGFYRHLGWHESGHLDDGQLRFVKDLSQRPDAPHSAS